MQAESNHWPSWLICLHSKEQLDWTGLGVNLSLLFEGSSIKSLHWHLTLDQDFYKWNLKLETKNQSLITHRWTLFAWCPLPLYLQGKLHHTELLNTGARQQQAHLVHNYSDVGWAGRSKPRKPSNWLYSSLDWVSSDKSLCSILLFQPWCFQFWTWMWQATTQVENKLGIIWR